MSEEKSNQTRRDVLATSVAASVALTALSNAPVASAVEDGASADIRPFRANIAQSDIDEMLRRVRATRLPPRETVSDQSQGARLERIRELVRYWGSDYDWRRGETLLNRYPQFVTRIDGLDIHFIHVRSRNPNALPLIVTHGWPGSVFEQIKIIEPLTNPTRHGGRASDAFDIVIPSMPGYGFSEQPANPGWNADRMGVAWDTLMKRLGYRHYVSAGGDWGSVVADKMAARRLEGLLGIHVNMPATVPPEAARPMASGDQAPPGLSQEERAAYDQLNYFFQRNGAYGAMMTTRPQTIGYSFADSPAGLAAWIYDKYAQWTDSGGEPERVLSYDEMLDNISLYWLTNSGTSAAQLYWENNANNFNAVDIEIPAAVTIFPGEIYRAPRSWTERAYHNLIYFNEVDRGGHFAAWEQPELYARELRAAFRSLRQTT